MDVDNEQYIVRGIRHQISEIVNYRQFYTKEFEDTAVKLLRSLVATPKRVREDLESQIKQLAWRFQL